MRQNLHKRRRLDRAFYSMDWFVLLVISSGFISYVQDFILGRTYPFEIVVRGLLLMQVAGLLVFGRTRAWPLSSSLTLSIILFFLCVFVTPALRIMGGDDVMATMRALYFMLGTALFLLFLPFTALSLGRLRLLPIFALANIAFATLQSVSQDLQMSVALRTDFGLLYETFSNGRLRVVGFFPSAPRFAEFLVLILLFLFFGMTKGRRRIVVNVAACAVCVWLMINTYSRSGYTLFTVTASIMFLVRQRHIFGAWRLGAVLARLVVANVLVVALIAAAGIVNLDALKIVDVTSWLARIDHWVVLQANISHFTALQYMFGSGDAAMYSRSELDYFVVDNLYIGLFLYCGLAGTTFFFLMFLATVQTAIAELRRSPDSKVLPILVFYIGLAVEGFFVDNHNTVFLTQLCLLGAVIAERNAQTAQTSQRPGTPRRARDLRWA